MVRRKQDKNQEEDNDDGKKFSVKIDVKINNKTIKEDVEDALHIPTIDQLNTIKLSNMMSESASLHARWNFIYNEAVYEYDIAKTKFEVWDAKIGKTIRKELAKLEKGRVTDKMVEEAKKLDPEYETLNEDLALKKKNMKHILALANGFGEKNDKIVNIASMMKWEAELLNKNKNAFSGKKEYGHIKKEETPVKTDPDKNDGWPT